MTSYLMNICISFGVEVKENTVAVVFADHGTNGEFKTQNVDSSAKARLAF